MTEPRPVEIVALDASVAIALDEMRVTCDEIATAFTRLADLANAITAHGGLAGLYREMRKAGFDPIGMTEIVRGARRFETWANRELTNATRPIQLEA